MINESIELIKHSEDYALTYEETGKESSPAASLERDRGEARAKVILADE